MAKLSSREKLLREYSLKLYISTPKINKPIKGIYADLDRASAEDGAPGAFPVLPPLRYEKRFLKGILLASKLDWLQERFPNIPDIFHTVVSSQWCSYPRNRKCDGLLIPYHNPHRDNWFREYYPDRAHQAIIHSHEADWTNESAFFPAPEQEKDIDLLCVSRFAEFKNLPMLAKSLRIYHQKYKKLTVVIPWGDVEPLRDHQKNCYRKLVKAFNELGCKIEDYVHFIRPRLSPTKMPQLYRRSKAYILCSLIEGKNRGLHEAMLSDVPVICARQHNQYARGDVEVFPPGAGVYAQEFHPEAFADAIHQVLSNLDSFKPRQAYLKHPDFGGRFEVFNRCIDRLSYYKKNIPGFQEGNHHKNSWLEAAIMDNYGIDLRQYLYRGINGISDAENPQRAPLAIKNVLELFFNQKF